MDGDKYVSFTVTKCFLQNYYVSYKWQISLSYNDKYVSRIMTNMFFHTMTNMVLAHMANMVLAATFERKVFSGQSFRTSLNYTIAPKVDSGSKWWRGKCWWSWGQHNMIIWTLMMLSAIFAGTFEFGLQRIVPKCGASSYKSTTFTAENKHSRKHTKEKQQSIPNKNFATKKQKKSERKRCFSFSIET